MLSTIVKYGGAAVTGLALMGTLTWAGVTQTEAAATTPVTASQTLYQTGPINEGLRPGEGMRDELRKRGQGALVAGGLIHATAEETGLSIEQVIEQLQAGQSLAAIAAANGSNADAVIAAAAARAEERLDQAVTNGRITQEEADAKLAELIAQANDIINDDTLGERIEQRVEQGRDRIVMAAMVKTTADQTGLPVQDVMQRLRDGETLEQIARSAGLSSAEVVDAAVEQFRSNAEEAMTSTLPERPNMPAPPAP
jgi:uncharacterized protein (DUF433 family)